MSIFTNLGKMRPLLIAGGMALGLLLVLLFSLTSVGLAAPPAPETALPDVQVTGTNPAAERLQRPAAPLGKSTLGDYVWYDYNADGEYLGQNSEKEYVAGVDDVKVNLYLDTNKDGIPQPSEYVTSTLTGENPNNLGSSGWYTFSVTAEGNQYIVQIDPINFASGGPLAGYEHSSINTYGTYTNTLIVAFGPALIDTFLKADFGYAKSGLTLTKELVSPINGYATVSNTVTYRIVVKNTGWVPIVSAPLYDYFTPSCLELLGASIPPDEVDASLGVLHWDDILANTGPLAPGASTSVYVIFHARKSGDMYWKEGGWADYAPKGMPDFDQKQDNWYTLAGNTKKWYACGPVAAANSLWWFDSKFEPNPQPITVTHSGYPLVPSFGAWDDHDPRNVEPFVNTLAGLMATSGAGTNVHALTSGVQQYIAQRGLANQYTVIERAKPVFPWVADEVRRSEDVILLLGFWQEAVPGTPASAARIGGHYVTVAGADLNGAKIAFSDPHVNHAETGGAGRVLPGPHIAQHPTSSSVADAVHNDAKYLSQDLYSVIQMGMSGGTWGAAGYATTCSAIEDFISQNAGDYANSLPFCIAGRPIYAVVEYAVAVSPVTASATCDPTVNIAVVSDAVDELGYVLPDAQDETPVRIKDPVTLIGDYVWLDEDADTVQDAGEAGIPNLTVNLYDSGGALVATTTTDEDGGYLFSGPYAGAFTVKVMNPPAGLIPTYDENGIGTPNETVVVVTSGEEHLTADFGYDWSTPTCVMNPGLNCTGAIGDRVWIDADGDGAQDPGEAGLPNVPVTLRYDSNGDGTIDTTWSTTTTGPDGLYIFDDLPPGIYEVIVTPPGGYTQTGDPDGTLDNRTTAPVVLAPGDVYVNADFGYRPTGTSSTIGDQVYLDTNGNGVFDGADYNIPGVTVVLLDSNGKVIATDITDASGLYSFPGLPAGTYTVWVNDIDDVLDGLLPTGDPDGGLDDRSTVTVDGVNNNLLQDFGYTPPGQTPVLNLIGDTIFLDRNANNLPDAGEGIEGVTVQLFDAAGSTLLLTTVTDENGHYYFGGLPDGTYTVKVDVTTLPAGVTNTYDPDGAPLNQSVVSVSGGVSNLLQDFGYRDTSQPNTIGGTIWQDTDADGTKQVGETGVYPGVTVVLLDSQGHIVATTTTNANGDYTFTNLPDGTYRVDVTDDANLLNGAWKSDGPNLGADNNSQPDPYTVTVSGGQTNTTGDFGYYRLPAALGNWVWYDANFNGIQDSGEVGIPGITVKLTITYPNTVVSLVADVTDASGLYSFENLLLDEQFNGIGANEPLFSITVTAPAIYVASPQNQTGEALDSDNPAGQTAYPIKGTTDNTYDFGFDVPMSYTITKTLNTQEPVRPNEEISFTIRIVNTGKSWLTLLPLTDVYSTTYLSYGYSGRYASPVPSNDTTNDGQIDWTNVLNPALGGPGPLAPDGSSVSLVVTFTAVKDTSDILPGKETENKATAHDVVSDPDGPNASALPPEVLSPLNARDWVTISKPTGLVLAEFAAAAAEGGVRLDWQTANEAQVLGFNVLRQLDDGALVPVNIEPIFAQYAGANQGATYTYLDAAVSPGLYTYVLEILMLNGGSERSESVRVTVGQ